MYDGLVQNGCDLKNLYQPALELLISLQPLQKKLFRTRVMKLTSGLHRKRHGFEYFPDPTWPSRTRGLNATIFFGGKTEFFGRFSYIFFVFVCKYVGMLNLAFGTLR